MIVVQERLNNMRSFNRYFILAAVFGGVCCLGQLCVGAEVGWNVWTVSDTRHVLRSELPGTLREARLAAARNEWRSFQILMRSWIPIQGIKIEPGDLRGPDGALIKADKAMLYRQHQLFLENGTYRNETFKPDWYPDPLIPFVHPLTGGNLEGARIRAVPFDLPAGQTHGFWVDLYVPSDAKAGEYRGVYRVAASGQRAVDVPVILSVWDFVLPKVPAMQTSFGSPAPRLREYYRKRAAAGQDRELQDLAAVEEQCAQLMAGHRLNASPPSQYLRPVAQPDGSSQIPPEQLDKLRQFVESYHVNALQIPHPSSVIKDPVVERDKLRAWLAAFNHAASRLGRTNLLFYTYLKDEPNTQEDYRYVQTWGRAIREAGSVVKVLVVEQPWTAPGQGGADSGWGDLYGAVDIWCPLFSLHRQESAAQRQALGETIWTYTALCQGRPTPWWHIDYPLLNYRVPAWIAWRYGMKGLLYWGGMSYWGNTDDPWEQPPVYAGSGAFQQGRKGIRFNGEGSLAYPARQVGYEGLVPTIRLKALRDGIQDYDYMALLEGLGKRAEAEAIVRPLAGSFFEWEKDAAAYDNARTKLAEKILSSMR